MLPIERRIPGDSPLDSKNPVVLVAAHRCQVQFARDQLACLPDDRYGSLAMARNLLDQAEDFINAYLDVLASEAV
ncbi:MAG: hypothetical protein AAF609_12555 [Cyanobacteria bacterium P01_C01_bin.120]